MSALRIWWQGAGVGAWLGSGLALMAVTLFLVYRPLSDEWIEHGRQNLGPYAITVASHGPVAAGAKIKVRIRSDAPRELQTVVQVGINEASRELRLSGEQEIELAVPNRKEALELHISSSEETLRWYLGRPL